MVIGMPPQACPLTDKNCPLEKNLHVVSGGKYCKRTLPMLELFFSWQAKILHQRA